MPNQLRSAVIALTNGGQSRDEYVGARRGEPIRYFLAALKNTKLSCMIGAAP